MTSEYQKSQQDVHVQEGKYGNALQAVSSEGHNAIMKLLLEKGQMCMHHGP